MFVHSSRVRRQIEHLQSLGISPGPLLERAQIEEDQLLDPEKTFSFEQYHLVLEYAVQQTGDEYYGLRMGREPHIAGTIGTLSASCKNLREAFISGCRYFGVQGNFADISFLDDDRFPRIRYTLTNAWRLQHPETARHEVDTMFGFLTVILRINSNHTLWPYQVLLEREPPSGNEMYEEAFGVTPLYEQEENEMVFRANDLLIPMKAFNPETYALLKDHVESQLKKFHHQERVSDRVRNILLSSFQYRFPDIDKVASSLHMSSRTLQRQLSSERTSYKILLQETRFELAKKLLERKELTISEISYTLGYSDISNFSRSFKNYSGSSPQQFRQQLVISTKD